MRRRLVAEALAVALSSAAFGLVYGVAARGAGLSLLETAAMSVVVLAGSAQFAAVGLLAHGSALGPIVATTIALNARHLLYGAAMLPWLATRSIPTRAAAAYVLSDEVFALSLAHFSRIKRADLIGYGITAIVPAAWIVTGTVGYLAGGLVPDPARWGLGVVFPIAMGGLALGFLTSAPPRIAAAVAAIVGVLAALIWPYAVAVLVATVVALVVSSRSRPRPRVD